MSKCVSPVDGRGTGSDEKGGNTPSPRMVPQNFRKTMFQQYLIPLMEANGWIVERKSRSNKPGHIDWYFFPPGVVRGRGFKMRVDFWDSVPLLMAALERRTSDALAQFVFNVYHKGKDVEKAMSKKRGTKGEAFEIDKFVTMINIPLPNGIVIPENIRDLWDGSLSISLMENLSDYPLSPSSTSGTKRKPVFKPMTVVKKRGIADDIKQSTAISVPNISNDVSVLNSLKPRKEIRLIENLFHNILHSKPRKAKLSTMLTDTNNLKCPRASEESKLEKRLLRNLLCNIEFDKRRKSISSQTAIDAAKKPVGSTPAPKSIAPGSSKPANGVCLSENRSSERARSLKSMLSAKCNNGSKKLGTNTISCEKTHHINLSLSSTDQPIQKKPKSNFLQALPIVGAPRNDISSCNSYDSSIVKIPRKRKENLGRSNYNNDVQEGSSNQKDEHNAAIHTLTLALESQKIPRKGKSNSILESVITASSRGHPCGDSNVTATSCFTKTEKNNSPHIGLDNAAAAPSDQQTDRKIEYLHFQHKIQPVHKIEFKGLHGQIVNKFLWRKHKELYGCFCNDNCPCLSNLKKLFEGVLAMAEQSAKAQGKEAPQVSRAGFVSSFASRYYEQLSKDFPLNSPAKILLKLLKMWEVHKKMKRFGESCSALCSCDYSSLAKCLPLLTSAIPSSQATSGITASPTSPPSSIEQRTEYCIKFDPSAPLGFYATTSTKDFSSCCKVASVNPYKTNMDPRVSRGTIVRAAEIDGERKEIESHLDLKNRYFTARILKKKLTLWFLNQNIAPHTIESQKRHWSLSGTWQGINEDGWAGGADVVTKGHTISHGDKSIIFEKSCSSVPVVVAGDFLTWSVQPRSAQRIHPLTSAFKRPDSKKSGLKVKIGERLNKTIFFEKDDLEELSKSKLAVVGNYTDLTYAVRHCRLQDVLNVLTRGVDVEDKDKNNMTALQYTNENFSDAEQPFTLDTSDLEQMNGLKRKLLKFFIEANSVIYACDALYHWSYAKVSVSGFRGLAPLDFSNSNFLAAPNSMFYTIEVGNIFFKSPCFPFGHSPTWPEHSTEKFSCEFHLDSYKENEINVTLYAGDHSKNIPLGKWTEDIDESIKISKDKTTNFVSKLQLNSTFFSQEVQEGEMMWRLEREKFDPRKAEDLRSKLAARLFTLTNWLNKLMQEAVTFQMVIDANIEFPLHGKRTLLHAAVYLQDQKLVKRLLDLGADPCISGSKEGSPIEVAAMKSYSLGSRNKEIHSLLMNFQKSTAVPISFE